VRWQLKRDPKFGKPGGDSQLLEGEYYYEGRQLTSYEAGGRKGEGQDRRLR